MTPQERDALVWVRNALDPTHPEPMPEWLVFDMNNWMDLPPGDRLTCGTACCIGGTLQLRLAGLATPEAPRTCPPDYDEHLNSSPEFYALFFRYTPHDGHRRTPEEAVVAIDRFLSGNTYDPWRVL